jgi:capsular polysaccharide biosynthesis protein
MISLGIREDKCIWSDNNTLLQADEIIATSFPGLRRNYAQWVPRYLQTSLKPITPTPKGARNIYISRKGTRKIINEEQILAIARRYDIEFADLIEEPRQPELFHDCQVVIGAHGAALANIAFCKSNTKVLELMPSDHQFPYYFTLAGAGQLDYHCLIGDSLGKRSEGSFGPSPFDFWVEPNEFEATLQLMVT